MTRDTVTVTFRCNLCGTKIEWPDDAIDSTKIACKNCGTDHGTYRDLRDAAMKATKDKVERMLKDALKGL